MDVESQKLREAISVYDSLVGELRKNLSSTDSKMVDLRLASIRLPDNMTRQVLTSVGQPTISSTEQAVAQDRRSIRPQRYLGEASDIQFFHTMESTFGQSPALGQANEGDLEGQVDSYEQDSSRHNEFSVPSQCHACLPPRALADDFVNVYFSTIHLAYPFVSEPEFREKYENFWLADSLDGFAGPWLSTLCKCVPPMNDLDS